MEILVQEYLNNNCGFLNEEDIYFINSNDNGPVNNVIKGLCTHSFGIFIESENFAGEYHLFYINNEANLTGLICRLNFLHPQRNEITYAFSSLINKYFPKNCRLLRVFNNYQGQTITLADKFGYKTYGDEINKNDLLDNRMTNELYIPFCNKLKVFKDIFNHNFPIVKKGEKINYIYLMYNSRNDFIKIGRSINPKQREKTLQGEDPELGIIAIWKQEKIHEKVLHTKFENKRKRGEWFDLDISDLINIKYYMDERKWL